MKLLELPIATTKQQRLKLWEFLEKTGYGPNDVLSLNYDTGIFLTRGGGKYQLKDHKIKHIAGPNSDPNERM